MKNSIFYSLVAGLLLTSACVAQKTPPYSAAREAKIDSLLRLMTLEEKCGQLNFVVGNILTGPAAASSVSSSEFDAQIRNGQVTGIFNTNGTRNIRHLQEVAVRSSRLGIPLLIGADVIHGYRTVTPIPLGEAASWDLEAIERAARVAAAESSAAGINWTFAPMVDIARDARWGRAAEGAGEDPYLGSLVAAARVKGFQGNSLRAPNTIAACIKHFAAYGAAEAGREYNTVDMSMRRLRESYLPPYKAGIDAGAATVMSAFNELDGVPASGNALLLDTILRREWGFGGVLVSDWQSIEEMIAHGNVANRMEAGELSMNASLDMDMMAYIYLRELPTLVKNGKVSTRRLDEAVRRVLGLKYDLGLFDNPFLYCDEKREATEILSPQHREAARDIARKSIVLLQNSAGTLPLSKTVKSIALIGPLADDQAEMNGCWSFFGEAKDVVTIARGIREKVGGGCTIRMAKGCDLYSPEEKGFSEAVEAARQSDVVVLAVGEAAVMNGEAGSRADIRLPQPQENLVKAILATGKPVVVCLFHGRPLEISFLENSPAAVLACWTPGTEAGHAVADVLFGDYNPSGRLPMTFPRAVGQVPLYYSYKPTGRLYTGNYNEPPTERVYRSKYRDTRNGPLFPFGFGLSYTTFRYSPVTLSKSTLQAKDSLTASVTVTNTGTRDGETVVQLYLRDWVGSVTRPVRELQGFRKIALRAGESRTISFTVDSGMLSFWRKDMTWGTEPGRFTVYIGEHAETENGTDFYLK